MHPSKNVKTIRKSIFGETNFRLKRGTTISQYLSSFPEWRNTIRELKPITIKLRDYAAPALRNIA